MDKIQFAKLVSFVSGFTGKVFDGVALEQLESLTDPTVTPTYEAVWTTEKVAHIFYLFHKKGKIEAIKEVRHISGLGLKQAKDLVEGLIYGH